MITNPAWRKSTYSGVQQGECVEVADLTSAIALRDSKDPHGPRLTLDVAAWRTLTRRIKNGDHDIA